MPIVNTVRGSFGGQGRFNAKKIGAGSTGGVITTAGGYRIHTFSTVGNSTFTSDGLGTVEVLVVAGGGGGAVTGAGGGAGGLLYSTTNAVSVSPYTVTVGDGSSGGAGNGSVNIQTTPNGGNSSFNGLLAFGGGGGLTHGNTAGQNGGSGSGGPIYPNGVYVSPGGLGTAGQGNNGGVGFTDTNWGGLSGGGGGAGQAGYPGLIGTNNSVLNGRGGDGVSNSISGSAVFYAGGGNGGEINAEYVSTQSPAGGGGLARLNDTGLPGTNGRGSGGGGGAFGGGSPGPFSGETYPSGSPYWRGGNGGSGVVIIRYTI